LFEIFNVEKISKKMTAKVFKIMKVKEKFNDKEIKIFRWIGEVLPVKLSKIIIAILTFMLFNLIYKTFGIDYIILIGVIVMILQLKNIVKEVKKLTS